MLVFLHKAIRVIEAGLKDDCESLVGFLNLESRISDYVIA